MHTEMLKLVIERCRKRQLQGGRMGFPNYSVDQLENAVIQLADDLESQRAALKRLASFEAFTLPQVLDRGRITEELLARMDFAERVLSEHAPKSDDASFKPNPTVPPAAAEELLKAEQKLEE